MNDLYPCPHLPGDLKVTSLTCSARYALGQKLNRYSADTMVDRYSTCKTCEIGRDAHMGTTPDGDVSRDTNERIDHVQYVSKGSLNSSRRIAEETQAVTLNTVRKNPGLSTNDFAKLLAISESAARARLRTVELAGRVVSVERRAPSGRRLTPQWFLKETCNG